MAFCRNRATRSTMHWSSFTNTSDQACSWHAWCCHSTQAIPCSFFRSHFQQWWWMRIIFSLHTMPTCLKALRNAAYSGNNCSATFGETCNLLCIKRDDITDGQDETKTCIFTDKWNVNPPTTIPPSWYFSQFAYTVYRGMIDCTNVPSTRIFAAACNSAISLGVCTPYHTWNFAMLPFRLFGYDCLAIFAPLYRTDCSCTGLGLCSRRDHLLVERCVEER